ncbi:hypothetical protein [Bradyrhizobium sp. URHD0069]|uniref:hypothetical protein n=1 Tax=Bradyrhizobium sp. URHD0069 TaxID=1380355 RepID=UPI0018CC5B53|nr:hypothetical protein [Bradyrhizobium sp. URHD0069]
MRTNRREAIPLLVGAAPAVLGMLSAAGVTTPSHAQQARRVATTGQDQSQGIETRIGRLEFTHDFANGYPTDATIEKLYDERDFQRACQAYLWSLPAVSFASWQRGVTKDLNAKNGQIVAILSIEARRWRSCRCTLTPSMTIRRRWTFWTRVPRRGVGCRRAGWNIGSDSMK